MTDKRDEAHFIEVEAAMAYGGSIGSVGASDAFNICANHVAQLLEDAFACYLNGSFGTTVFLSVTALEETSKAEILVLRSRNPKAQTGRDPLRNHKSKHRLAVRPTTFMGRLPSILGKEACERLRNEADSGNFLALRETGLYVHADDKGVRAPKTVISPVRSREILLLALESADDILVGSTNHSYRLGERFEEMISNLK